MGEVPFFPKFYILLFLIFNLVSGNLNIYIYIYSLLLFVIDNGDYFKVNSEIHNINIRNKSNLHLQISNLSVHQKGTYYTGIRVFNSLPSQIKELCHNRNQFKRALKNFLYFHLFYTLDEYFSCNKILQWLHCVLSNFRLLVSIVMYCNTELNAIYMFYILCVTTPFWNR